MANDRIGTKVKTLGGNDPWAQGQAYRPTSETLIARQAVAQTFKDHGAQRVSDILSGRYDFSTDMIVAKATVALTLELSDRTAR
jgi:hypothetical protein